MKKPSTLRPKPDPATVTFPLPVLDDATPVMIYNFLCELVDRFDSRYCDPICRFYAQPQRDNNSPPPITHPDDSPF